MLNRRNVILILFATCLIALSFLLIWRGPLQTRQDLESIFSPPRALLTLEQLNAPPETGPGCLDRLTSSAQNIIRLSSDFTQEQKCVVTGALYADRLAGLPFSPRGPLMRCEVADPLNTWLEEVVKPAALRHLGTEILKVGHLGTYNCRSISSGRRVLSQHSFANAIDIAWFELADGRRIELKDGWSSDEEDTQKFWQQIHRLSCRYFDVSLSPNYDTAHEDHFHLDMGPFRSCR